MQKTKNSQDRANLMKFLPKMELKQDRWVAKSPLYTMLISSSETNKNQRIFWQVEKRDQRNLFFIYTSGPFKKNLELRHTVELESFSYNSYLYRIRRISLGKGIVCLLLYFYQGSTLSYPMEGMAKLYMVTIEKGDFHKIYSSPGPAIWQEKEGMEGHYHQRKYGIKTADYDGDGIKEIVIYFGPIKSIYRYGKMGRWQEM